MLTSNELEAILLKIVSENLFSGKTYFIQLLPGQLLLDTLPSRPRPPGGEQVDLHARQRVVALHDSERQVGSIGSFTIN